MVRVRATIRVRVRVGLGRWPVRAIRGKVEHMPHLMLQVVAPSIWPLSIAPQGGYPSSSYFRFSISPWCAFLCLPSNAYGCLSVPPIYCE